MKRFLDVMASTIALIVFGPVIFISAMLIWHQDGNWPFYSPWRVGKDGKLFRLYKLRSMIIGADKSKVDTTTNKDSRITRIGYQLRRFKIDELPQFANVLLGHMSLVGPRPNIDREVNLYSKEENRILSVRPGITDLSSIIFSDLGNILAEAEDANIAYNQLIRPWKSRLALFYIDHRSIWMDIHIMWLTFVAILNLDTARVGIVRILKAHNASAALLAIAKRDHELKPTAPPGLDHIVLSRED